MFHSLRHSGSSMKLLYTGGDIQGVKESNGQATSRMVTEQYGHIFQDSATVIAKKLEEMRTRLDVSFVLQTLEYLHKGGRCSGVSALGANLLKLRPEIVVNNDGAMTVGRKYRGNMEKTVLDYIRGRLEGNDNVVPGRIMITHTDMPQEIVDKAEALVRSLHSFQEVCVTSAGSTIGSHCGPACIGVLFFRKTA